MKILQTFGGFAAPAMMQVAAVIGLLRSNPVETAEKPFSFA